MNAAGTDNPPPSLEGLLKTPALASPGDSRPSGLFRSSPLGQALSAYIPAIGIIRFINFARVLLLAWWMTRFQFGLLNIILLVVNVLTPLCSLGLFEAITRYVPQYETAGALLAFVRRSFVLLLSIATIGILLVVIFAPQLGDFFYAHELAKEPGGVLTADAARFARLTAMVTLLLIVYFFLASVMKGLRMFVALAAIETVHSLLFLAGSVVAWFTGHLSAFTLAAIYGGSLALPILWFGARLNRALVGWTAQHRGSVASPLYGKLLRFSLWTMLAGFTWQILIYYPAWRLNKTNGPEAVAVFSAVRQIGQLIMVGAVAISTVVMTTVTKTWESRGRPAAERQLSLAFRCTGLGLLLLCGIGVLAKGLIVRMFRPEYGPGADILPLQFTFFLICAYLAFLPAHFQLIETTRHMFWPWVIGVATNVLLAFWLTGENLGYVRDLGWWQALAPLSAAVFCTGFSDPQGLGAAGWCGIGAMACALVTCVLLIRAEHCRLDRGSYVLILSAILLAARSWILVVGLITVGLLAWRTDWVFNAEDRAKIGEYGRAARRFTRRRFGRSAGEGGR